MFQATVNANRHHWGLGLVIATLVVLCGTAGCKSGATPKLTIALDHKLEARETTIKVNLEVLR